MRTPSSLRLLALASALFMSPFATNVARAADSLAPPGPCPAILPSSQIEPGQQATGWTVVQGNEPRPFAVTILGIQPDGIAPGHDLAIIEIADKAGSRFVADAGGIWAGMSGSPVYVGDKLAGAVSYTFSRGPSMIGGMTLADDMAEILSYDEPVGDERVVELTAESRVAVAEHIGASLESVGSTFSRLPIPFVASGLGLPAREALQSTLEAGGFHGFLVPGSAAAAPSAGQGFHVPVPGGNFAALVSYGDVTIGGVGTTTYVCGDQALAFGHSLALHGATTFGANDASAFAIVNDPTEGPFKLAAIGPAFGLLDHDRIAGIGATLGASPELIPIVSRIRSVELDRKRYGRTDITMHEFVRSIATSHIIDNITAATDRNRGGTAVMRWKIRGTRHNGAPWEVVRTDRMTSRTNVAITAAIELLNDLVRIDENEFEAVVFGGVAITGRVNAVGRQDRIDHVRVSKNGGAFQDTDKVTVAPGDVLTLRVAIRKPSSRFRQLDVEVVIPATARGSGRIVVGGGTELGGFDCFSHPDTCPRSFPQLLQAMAAAPRADDVVADLSFFAAGTDKHYQSRARHRAFLIGRDTIEVTVSGS